MNVNCTNSHLIRQIACNLPFMIFIYFMRSRGLIQVSSPDAFFFFFSFYRRAREKLVLTRLCFNFINWQYLLSMPDSKNSNMFTFNFIDNTIVTMNDFSESFLLYSRNLSSTFWKLLNNKGSELLKSQGR